MKNGMIVILCLLLLLAAGCQKTGANSPATDPVSLPVVTDSAPALLPEDVTAPQPTDNSTQPPLPSESDPAVPVEESADPGPVDPQQTEADSENPEPLPTEPIETLPAESLETVPTEPEETLPTEPDSEETSTAEPVETPPAEPEETDSPEDLPEDTEEPAPDETDELPTEIDSPEDQPLAAYVQDIVSLEGNYQDSDGKTYYYCYYLPNLKAETEDALEINQEIRDALYGDIEFAQETMTRGEELELLEVDWFAPRFGDVLSLVIEYKDWDYEDYLVYNYNLRTGCRMSNAELLAYMDIAESEFLSGTRTEVLDCFDEYYQDYSDSAWEEDGIYELRTWTKENVSTDSMIFVSENGRLGVIAEIGTPAGRGYVCRVLYPMLTVG